MQEGYLIFLLLLHYYERKIVLLLAIATILISCGKDDVPIETSLYKLVRPDYFPQIKYPIENNPISKEGFELGKNFLMILDYRLTIVWHVPTAM